MGPSTGSPEFAWIPPSEKVGGSGKQFKLNSLLSRLAKKFFLGAAGWPAALSPWKLTDFAAGSSAAAADGSPLKAFKASRNEL